MLVRKAAKLFVHIKDIIAKSSLASSMGQEYSAFLRANLLPISQYCNVVSSLPFQGNCTMPLSSTLRQILPNCPNIYLCVFTMNDNSGVQMLVTSDHHRELAIITCLCSMYYGLNMCIYFAAVHGCRAA